jgi:hypothetical protein
LVLLLPFMLAVALLIRITSPGAAILLKASVMHLVEMYQRWQRRRLRTGPG